MGTESAACYKMELERPGGRTREEVDVEWREKSHFLKEFGFSLKWSCLSHVIVNKGYEVALLLIATFSEWVADMASLS